jgi:hypothetical protein
MDVPLDFAEVARCTLGPRLLARSLRQNRAYAPHDLEAKADTACYWSVVVARCCFTFPIGALLLLRLLLQLRSRGELSAAAIVWASWATKLVVVLAFTRLAGQLCRGISRASNAEYSRFLRAYHTADEGQRHHLLVGYDFEVRPHDYVCRGGAGERRYLPPRPYPRPAGWQGVAVMVPSVTWTIATVLARRLIFPGSTWYIAKQMRPHLQAGRGELLGKFGGRRIRLRSTHGDGIDCMLVDRRGGKRGPLVPSSAHRPGPLCTYLIPVVGLQ